MQFDFHISIEELQNIIKKQPPKASGIKFIQRIMRSRREALSVVDLSKLIVDRKAESIIVSGVRFEYLCRTLAKQYHVFTMRVEGISLKEYCFNNRFSMLCNYNEYFWDTIEAVIDEDEARIKKIRQKILKYLRHAKPKAIITTSIARSRPFETLLYDAAKQCNIPVIFLEHGFLNNFTVTEEGAKKHLSLGEYIDFYWCWNQKNRDIYIENKITTEEKSFVLGYPLQPQEKSIGEQMSVLFVGDWQEEDDVEGNIRFYTIVNDIYQICSKLGIPFRYKGHPSEKQEKKSKYVEKYLSPDIIRVDDLFGEFRKNRIVVGCQTSALIQAGLIGDYVIQIIYDYKLQKDCIFGHCYVVEDYVRQFEPLIQAIKNEEIFPKEFSKYEFYQPEDLMMRFNEGMERVERYYTGKEEE